MSRGSCSQKPWNLKLWLNSFQKTRIGEGMLFYWFVCATVVIAFISRGPLRNPRSHGFYRFFGAAYEAGQYFTLHQNAGY